MERGIDFTKIKKNDGKCIVFVACKFGHMESIHFLENEVKMSLIAFDENEQSSLCYTLRRANFEMLWYLLRYYIKNDAFSKFENEAKNFLDLLNSCSKHIKQSNDFS